MNLTIPLAATTSSFDSGTGLTLNYVFSGQLVGHATLPPLPPPGLIDTIPAWNGSSSIATFGKPDTSTYGETFVASTDNVMHDFSFKIAGAAELSMKAQIYEWTGSLFGGNGGHAVGPALFTSSTIHYSGDSSFQTVLVDTGSLVLNPGTQYVALLTISDPSDYENSAGTTSWGIISGNEIPNSGGGGFVFFNNGNNIGALNTQVWDNFANFGTLAWTAHFSAVPEPSAIVLAGLSVVGMFVICRKSKSGALGC
jgi:hypothetical protein